MVELTRRPETASKGNGHHTGAPWNPSPSGNRPEEPALHEGDQLEKAVGHGGDRRADERRHRQ